MVKAAAGFTFTMAAATFPSVVVAVQVTQPLDAGEIEIAPPWLQLSAIVTVMVE
jgi:hypothetical protein